MLNVYDRLDFGEYSVKKGDRGYNKNKRLQVENPCEIMFFIEGEDKSLSVVLQDENGIYTVEPLEHVEKYVEIDYNKSDNG